MDGLKDIKDVVVVEDFSLWIFVGTVFVSLAIVSYGIYKFATRRKKRKKLTRKQICLEALKRINFSDTKDVVYTFSQNFPIFLSDENSVRYANLQEKLVEFKYKKEVQELPRELKDEIKQMIKSIK